MSKENKYLSEEEENQKSIKKVLSEEEKQKLGVKCIKDNDCGSDQVCAFNENDENHYCISNKLYLGCLKDNYKLNRYISSVQDSDVSNMEGCYKFARKLNSSDILYDYFVYRPKTKTPITKDSVKIKLKCGDMTLIELPYEESFKAECDVDNEICTFIPKDNILAMIKNNVDNCKNNYHLEVRYKCDVENKENLIKIPIKDYNNISFKISCPINDDENNPYKAKCTAFSLSTEAQTNLDKAFDTTKVPAECKNPSFLVPNIITDLAAYRAKNKEKIEKNMEKYESIIAEDEYELNKKKALQYMMDYEKQFNQKISFQDAFARIKSQVEHLETTITSNNWPSTPSGANVYLNTLPLSDVSSYNSPYKNMTLLNKKDTSGSYILLNNYTELYTLLISDPSYDSYDYIFFFPKETYTGQFSGYAYGASVNFLTNLNIILDKDKIKDLWSTVPNTYTIMNISTTTSTKYDTYMATKLKTDYDELSKAINNNLNKLNELQLQDQSDLDGQKSDVDSLITMMNQKIKNLNYQSDVNKQIIKYLYYFLIAVFILAIIYFVYQYYPSNNVSN